MQRSYLSFILFLALQLSGLCMPQASAAKKCPVLGPRLTAEQYCAKYAEIAREEMRKSGVPASITLAQGMLESGYGSSYLAVKANNHFGIKAYSRGWKGPVVRCDDDARDEPFCSFGSVEEGYAYHSQFLCENPRYARLFKLDIRDYEGWAVGLKECGYATSPTYAKSLIDLIERYHLDAYDTPGKAFYSYKHPLYRTGNDRKALKYVRCVENDDLSVIAAQYGIKVAKLRRANDLPKYYTLHEGDIIYLQSKRVKAEPGYDVHVVRPGESMWSIAQTYGVTIKSIMRRNKLKSATVYDGQVLKLR